MITEDCSDDLPEALKRGFLSALASTRKLLQKGWTIPQEPCEPGSLEKVIAAEEHGSLVTTPLSNVLPYQVSVEATPLSNLDKETEWYIEQILMDVAVEVPSAPVSPKSEGAREPLESEHGEPTGMEAPIVKGISVAEVRRKEARPKLAADDGLGLRKEVE